MIFDRNENKAVSVLLGAGSMGTAILRRVCAGTKILSSLTKTTVKTIPIKINAIPIFLKSILNNIISYCYLRFSFREQ